MGMFRPTPDDPRLSKEAMKEQMIEAGAKCLLCETSPTGFVYDHKSQSVWCPRCGMPPVPAPQFMEVK
jgi:hypothetical protein